MTNSATGILSLVECSMCKKLENVMHSACTACKKIICPACVVMRRVFRRDMQHDIYNPKLTKESGEERPFCEKCPGHQKFFFGTVQGYMADSELEDFKKRGWK